MYTKKTYFNGSIDSIHISETLAIYYLQRRSKTPLSRSITTFLMKTSTRYVSFQFNRDEEIIMKNIKTAIFPFLLAMCMHGLSVFEYRGQPRLYLTILYILASWLLYIYTIVQTEIFFTKFNFHYPLIMYFIVIVALAVVLITIYYHKV